MPLMVEYIKCHIPNQSPQPPAVPINKCFGLMHFLFPLPLPPPATIAVGAQVFPLPPGQGFPWAHSTRGKPRRGMMRRAVFSGA